MKKIICSAVAVMFVVFACQKKDVAKESSDDVALSLPGRVVPTTQVTVRKCAADEVLQRQIAEKPARGAFLDELERKTQAFRTKQENGVFRIDETLYVPVVLHIVLPDPNQVSQAQINSQFDVLKKDFSKANAELFKTNVYLAGYSYDAVANCKIEFYVSQVVRKPTTVTSFGTNDAVKKSSQGGSDPVDPNTKMNFWVCDLSGGYLGYAQFPGGAAATDGIVVDYQAFGTTASYPLYRDFNLGRTATHEIGHWINLRHIWGDRRCGTDYVEDTPAHDAYNSGCPSAGLKSLCRGTPLEQWMNYMDYTDDRCMYMFSGGQKTRMDAAIANARSAYFSSTASVTK